MTDFQKLVQSRKAAILSAAEKQASEAERDLRELERLANKYGLKIVDAGTQETKRAQTLLDTFNETLIRLADASVSAKAKAVSEAYIREQNRPVPLGELFEMLESHGIKFASDTPRNTLSAILGQAPALYSISRDKGWWLKGVPEPINRRL